MNKFDSKYFLYIFEHALKKIKIKLDKNKLNLFLEYWKELIFWNHKLNLISLKTCFDIPIKHFIDSLILTKFILFNNDYFILDIGSGAGFPGIPLKIFYPFINLIIVESNFKKFSFLQEINRKLNLNIQIINSRVEDLPNNYQFYFNIVISRATFKLKDFLKKSISLISLKGEIIAMKSIHFRKEQELANFVVNQLKLKLVKYHICKLPIINHQRVILVYK